MKKTIILISVFILSFLSLQAQKITQEDYNRAVSFTYENLVNKTVFNLKTNVNWFENGLGFWFVDYSKDQKSYKTVDFKTEKVSKLFNHKKLASALSKHLNKELKANNLSLSNVEKFNDTLRFSTEKKDFSIDLKSYQLKEINSDKEETHSNPFESKSPNGQWIAYTKDFNLYIKSVDSGEEFQLSKDGKKDYEYASWYGWTDFMIGENGARPKNFYVNWSGDSKFINANVIDTRNAEKMYLLDSSIDSLYRPKLMSYYRGSPGDSTLVKVKPVFYNIDTKQEVKTSLPTQTHINPVNARFTNTSGKVLASYKTRGFLNEYVKSIDLNTGIESTIIHETSKIGVDNFSYQLTKDDDKIIYSSEKSGWKQLYLLDLKTNETIQLTSGDFFVNGIKYIDEDNKIIYFLGSGKELGNNPYHQQLYKVTFKGQQTLLTPENLHHIVSFSKDGKYFVDNMSTIETPTKTVLRRSQTGEIVTQLTTADVSSIKAKGWSEPTPFSLKAKDGKTTIYGAFWKPSNFDPNKTYPIIDATYTGPHTQRFPKSFDIFYAEQSFAELGFIMVRIDGLGTSSRSQDFRAHSYLNMQNNLEDHVLAIKHLAKKHAFIDLDKVGIQGRSAGGYDTGRAMVGFPDFYKVGVATSGDHDFRMEKAWWPEMYMGWPVDERYHKASNITNAANLKGKLLLIHGGIDENVNPSATYKFAEALIKADKEFDLLIVPSQSHSYKGKYYKYVLKKRWNYFVEHLLEAKPIWNFNWN